MEGSVDDSSYRLREKADYQDFYIVSADQAKEQLARATELIGIVRSFLKTKWGE